MDDLIESTGGDPRQLESELGLEEGSLGETPVRVDVNNPGQFNLREPSPELSGSNDLYIGDGTTPGGQSEAVIDPFPNPEYNPDVGQITDVPQQKPEQTYGSSGDGYDFVGGTSGENNQEVANDYVNKGTGIEM